VPPRNGSSPLAVTSDGGRSFVARDPQPVLDGPLRRVLRVAFAG